MIAQNLDTIRRRMAAACRRAGRKPEEITLIAVTKTFGDELIREAVRAGCAALEANPDNAPARMWTWLAAQRLGGYAADVPAAFRMQVKVGWEEAVLVVQVDDPAFV